MKKRVPKRATEAEEDYVRDLTRVSAFDKLDAGEAKLLRPQELPEPLKRFMRRDRASVHVRLRAAARRRLDSMSRAAGISPDELARRWVEEALARAAG